MSATLAPSELDAHLLQEGAHREPHAVLGPHRDASAPGTVVVRALRPEADAVAVVVESGSTAGRYPLSAVDDAGLFAGAVPGPLPTYRLAVTRTRDDGETEDVLVDDPYRFSAVLGPVDLHLIGEGRHERLWDALGAHFRTWPTPEGTVEGTSFTVWAPHARGVAVIGDWDGPYGWAGTATPMRALSSGVWEVFLPGVGPGTRYRFRILTAEGDRHDKVDPLAFASTQPPDPCSVVTSPQHQWGDADWMARRAASSPHAEPMSIYELHLGSWKLRPDGGAPSYRELADELADHLTGTGFTHVELLPVAEHPYGGSWGYQVTSYYAPTSRFGSPDDFRYFVDRLHRAGIGVIVDWVPAHFPRDDWALARFDGTPCYEHGDPRRGEQLDWGTLVFDFGRSQVRNFLVANALYWLEEFHVDGLRVDAVASMLYLDYSRPDGGWEPNRYGGRENLEAVSFLQEVNATVYKHHPSAVTIAEESTSWPGVTRPTHLGGLGFGFKWNMGWMHDTLDYVGRDPVHRGYHHNAMTFALTYAWSENFVLPLSHDEVVHGKGSLWTRMPGGDDEKAAGLRALLAYMWAHPGKKLVFAGAELGQVREWSEERSLDWELLDDPRHGGVARLVGDLNAAYRAHSALWELDVDPSGFSWIDANDATGNVLSFLRLDRAGRPVACLANFSGSDHGRYRVGLPTTGRWRELLNTDAEVYAGRGVGNYGSVIASSTPCHGLPASAEVTLPARGVLWLVPDPG